MRTTRKTTARLHHGSAALQQDRCNGADSYCNGAKGLVRCAETIVSRALATVKCAEPCVNRDITIAKCAEAIVSRDIDFAPCDESLCSRDFDIATCAKFWCSCDIDIATCDESFRRTHETVRAANSQVFTVVIGCQHWNIRCYQARSVVCGRFLRRLLQSHPARLRHSPGHIDG